MIFLIKIGTAINESLLFKRPSFPAMLEEISPVNQLRPMKQDKEVKFSKGTNSCRTALLNKNITTFLG